MADRRPALVAMAVATVLAAAGCGGSDVNDYRGDVAEVQEKYVAELEKYRTDASERVPADPAAAVPVLQQLAATTTKLADELDGLDPPPDSRALGDDLVDAYRASAAAASQLAKAASGEDVAALTDAIRAFNQTQEREAAAISALNAAT